MKINNDKPKITSREENYSKWYLDVINAAELAENAPTRGNMIIKPYGYAIWEGVQKILDNSFKQIGVKNAYFPLLIPEKFLKKEKDHVKGFAPEVAVVTHAGGKKLKEPLVIRPTSETIIYAAFSEWINSYRDLPLLINQWANVVRWELRPRLFLRTTEFLWQEGHTAHQTKEKADDWARKILSIYRNFAEETLAIPVIAGIKSESEKFAGASQTYTIEAMMQDGKALQCATSHNLGDNFAKVFNVSFLNDKGKKEYAQQTSWGISTRIIGGIIMTHGDDKGIILPPKIAPIQTIVVAIGHGKDLSKIEKMSTDIVEKLRKQNISAEVDFRDIRPGEKFYEWEKKGVPIRIEVGLKELKDKKLSLTRRDTGEKIIIAEKNLTKEVNNLLKEIQNNLYNTALKRQNSHIKIVDDWKEFEKAIKDGYFVSAHWCGDSKIEKIIKEKTGATIRCIPLEGKKEKGKCIKTGKSSSQRVIFAKAY